MAFDSFEFTDWLYDGRFLRRVSSLCCAMKASLLLGKR